MRTLPRVGLAAACVAGMLATTWWVSRQLEAGSCLDGGHVFDWRRSDTISWRSRSRDRLFRGAA